jgi:hypothetical protein
VRFQHQQIHETQDILRRLALKIKAAKQEQTAGSTEQTDHQKSASAIPEDTEIKDSAGFQGTGRTLLDSDADARAHTMRQHEIDERERTDGLEMANFYAQGEVDWLKESKDHMHRTYRAEIRFIDKHLETEREVQRMMTILERGQDTDIREAKLQVR